MYLKKQIYLFFLFPAVLNAQEWQPKQAPLMSKFAKDVHPENVLPEYPRPQLVREKWLNLNGVWQYQPATGPSQALPEGDLSGQILVPFPVESALSGVMEHHETIWYRRKFKLPSTWSGQQIRLHFGAVDYQAEVFINGKSLCKHSGGFDPFDIDITQALQGKTEHDLAVRVYDPTDKGGYPRGKQTLKPGGITYRSVTGIWQTVWLEPVPESSISEVKIVPDIDHSVVKLTVYSKNNVSGLSVNVAVKDGNRVVKTLKTVVNKEVVIPIKNAKLWSPDSPFLYDLDLQLSKNKKQVDQVSSYFGMRKIAIAQDGDYKKMYLNNQFLFQIGPLDQGFWPDGGYTAPTDAALKYDLEMTKKFGFNMVRKHIKVEPQRWYYWADKLGLMVWQDMPSPNSYTDGTPPPVDQPAFQTELERMIKTHWNSPCIVSWVVFNEAQGQHRTADYVKLVHELDSTRIINQGSGWDHHGVGDVLDIHSYPPPAVPASKSQALACGEYGGIGYIIPGHIWKSGETYTMLDNEKAYVALYDQFATDLALYKTNNGLSAAVYTEITDIEGELNGLLTYDRSVVKADPKTIYESNHKTIHSRLYLDDVLPTSANVPQSWKYILENPGQDWISVDYDDKNWLTGLGSFGSEGTPGAMIKTAWTTHDVWLRKEFNLDALSEKDLEKLILSVYHDDACAIYLNGIKAAELNGASKGYTLVPLSAESRKSLIPGGTNVIAIHGHQDFGDQIIDLGIHKLREE